MTKLFIRKCLKSYGIVSADSVKSVFRSVIKRRHLGKFPNVAFIETDFDPTPKVKILSTNLVISYGALTFFNASACGQLDSRRLFHVSHVQRGVQENKG